MEFIENHQLLINAFGYWPDFHDSPIVRSALDGSSLELDLKVWEMTSQVDADGYFVLSKHHLVTFRIKGITESENPISFSDQNGLFSLQFSQLASGTINVGFDSFMGPEFDGFVVAKNVSVVSVQAYHP